MRRADLAVLAACALLAGCAALAPPLPARPMFRAAMPVAAAAAGIAPGRSSQADVAARLGEADRLRFDNGTEVWVYRAHPLRAGQPELVLLFGPDGLVRKVRTAGGAP